MNKAVAKLKNQRGSARKMRLVADLIRGLDVEKAVGILTFTQKQAALPLKKLLLSALANWQQKNPAFDIEESQLYVSTVFVDGGSIMRRFTPAPQGRAYRIRKRFCHITINIDSRLNAEQRAALETAVQARLEEAPATEETTLTETQNEA